MKCSLLTLSCALDGELSKERQAELEAHLVTCERCRTGMRYLHEETDRVAGLAQVTLPAATATALLERAKVISSEAAASAGAAPKGAARDAEALAMLGIEAELVEPPQTTPVSPAPTPAVAEGPEAPAEGGHTVPDDLTEETPDAAGPSGSEELSSTPAESVEESPPGGTSPWTAPVAAWAEASATPAAPVDASSTGSSEVDEQPPGKTPEPELSPSAEAEAPKPESTPSATPAVDSAETLQVAREESERMQRGAAAAAGAGAAAMSEASELPFSSGPAPETKIPPPPSVSIPPSPVPPPSTGWQPRRDLSLDPGDIAAAKPQLDPFAANAEPPGRRSLTPRPTSEPAAGRALAPDPTAEPVRRFGAAPPRTPSSSTPATSEEAPPSRRPPANTPWGRGRLPIPNRKPGAAPGYTRVATIAVAALALFLIGWTLTHQTGTTAAHHHLRPTPSSVVPTTSPTPKTTPTPTPTAATLALTGTNSFGGGGSGYQVQTVRYGLHDNNSQLWVVFQLVQGTGAPKVTTGWDGPDTLYLEMTGVAPGTVVPQPASGGLVTSIKPGHVPGFDGAVYVLQLSRSAQATGSLVPGSPTSSSGERVLLQLQ